MLKTPYCLKIGVSGCQAYCLIGCSVKQSDTSCGSDRIGYVINYICLNLPRDANEAVHFHTFCLRLMQAHWVISNIRGKLFSQTMTMGAISAFSFIRNFVCPVHKIDRISSAFTGKLNQLQCSAI